MSGGNIKVYKSDKSGQREQGFGSGYKIGDGYKLTAGHIVYEYNENPGNIKIVSYISASDLIDPRGYRQSYLVEAQARPRLSADNVESTFPLIAKDMVLIRDGGHAVGRTADGLALYLDPTMLTTVGFGLAADTELAREGEVSGRDKGSVVRLTTGGFVFSETSSQGDSGGGYLLRTDLAGEVREFVIGVQSAKFSNTRSPDFGRSIATLIDTPDWIAFNAAMGTGQFGNVTASEPVNLVVGSAAADGSAVAPIVGSFRADIMLGKDGDDVLVGDPTLSSAWGDDMLYGGAGNDTLAGGRGSDLLHGGEDGVAPDPSETDTVSYAGESSPVVLRIGGLPVDTRYQGRPGYEAAVFATMGSAAEATTDTLISIENILGSSFDDTIRIESLGGTRLASSSPEREGVATIDLGAQMTGGATGGDSIDFSQLVDGVRLRASGGDIAIQGMAFPGGTVPVLLTVKGAERVVGSAFGDFASVADATPLVFDGRGGRDIVVGGLGDDVLLGGADSDLVSGGAGRDVLHGGDGEDVLSGDDGDDDIYTGIGVGTAAGGAGSDMIVLGGPTAGVSGSAVGLHRPIFDPHLSGGDGHDRIVIRQIPSDVVVAGGKGNDQLIVEPDSGSIKYVFASGDGRDVLTMPDVPLPTDNSNGPHGMTGPWLVLMLPNIATSQLTFRFEVKEVGSAYWQDLDGVATRWLVQGDLLITVQNSTDSVLIQNAWATVAYRRQGDSESPQVWPGASTQDVLGLRLGIAIDTGVGRFADLDIERYNTNNAFNSSLDFSLDTIGTGFATALTDFQGARPTPPDLIL